MCVICLSNKQSSKAKYLLNSIDVSLLLFFMCIRHVYFDKTISVIVQKLSVVNYIKTTTDILNEFRKQNKVQIVVLKGLKKIKVL